MAEIRISSRYAKSLLVLSQEKHLLEEVNKDMKLILNTFAKSKDLQRLIDSPIVKSNQKIKVLASVFNDKISKLTGLFLATISKKGREKLIPSISEQFVNQYNIIHSICEVNVTSAIELDEKTKTEVKEFVENQSKCKAEISYKIDKNIIGGIVIRMEDQLYDFSISKKIKRLKQELVLS